MPTIGNRPYIKISGPGQSIPPEFHTAVDTFHSGRRLNNEKISTRESDSAALGRSHDAYGAVLAADLP